MPKFQQTRINDTLDEITEMERTGDLQQGAHPTADRLRGLVTALTAADKSTLNEALKRGDYTNTGPGITTWGDQRTQMNHARSNEKKERAIHRALLMVLALKSDQPVFGAAVQNASVLVDTMRNAVGAAGSDARLTELKNRLKQEVHNLNAALDMVRLQVQEMTFAGWDTTKRRNPLVPGCAIGQRGQNGPGTLGCFVIDGAGAIYILSNLHVMKQAGIGAGDVEIIQPAHLCGGSYTDVVADFVDGEVRMDAAIARVRPGIEVSQTIPGVNGFTISGTVVPYQWQLVKKWGCATGFRRGEINRAVGQTLPMPRAGFTHVDHLIEITRDGERDGVPNMGFQIPGDSGTILCALTGQVIALMNMGGGNRQQTGLATLIGPILNRFNVQILGPGVHVAP